MIIIKPKLLEIYTEINFCFSTKEGLDREDPFYFNTSLSVGDDEQKVKENREYLYNSIGLRTEQVAIQKQIHSDIVTYVDKGGIAGESDAMITDKPNLGLAISTADCTAIFIYDSENKVIAAVHSGWRGTFKKILNKTLIELKEKFNSKPENLIAYLAPSICKDHYEVGPEVAEQFDKKYLISNRNKYLLDVASANYDMLINFGLSKANLENSSLCSYQLKYLLHSYRRDGKRSGRALGVIVMR